MVPACDAVLCLSHTLQTALKGRQEALIWQIYFSVAPDSFNHQGILYKPCSVGIGGSVFCKLIQCLPNRSLYVMVDDCL